MNNGLTISGQFQFFPAGIRYGLESYFKSEAFLDDSIKLEK